MYISIREVTKGNKVVGYHQISDKITLTLIYNKEKDTFSLEVIVRINRFWTITRKIDVTSMLVRFLKLVIKTKVISRQK